MLTASMEKKLVTQIIFSNQVELELILLMIPFTVYTEDMKMDN